METVFGIVMVIFGFALICLVVYVLFFQKDKNPDELTNLEKRYVDPVLAEKQKKQIRFMVVWITFWKSFKLEREHT